MKMPWPGARGDAATRNAAGQLRHGADIFSLSANARSRRRKEAPSEGLQISRKHVAANPALCAPACVGQASRLFPSKEIPSPFGGGRPQAFETVASRRLFKVRDRRDACPTASFRIRASLRRLLRRGAHRGFSRGGISPRLGGARGKWSGNYGTERMRQKLFVAGLGVLVKTSAPPAPQDTVTARGRDSNTSCLCWPWCP